MTDRFNRFDFTPTPVGRGSCRAVIKLVTDRGEEVWAPRERRPTDDDPVGRGSCRAVIKLVAEEGKDFAIQAANARTTPEAAS